MKVYVAVISNIHVLYSSLLVVAMIDLSVSLP